MTMIDQHGRPEPPPAGDEVATLLGFLDYQRATLAWKTAGLGADGLATTVAASSMTLGGMLKHLARVEDFWFSQSLLGREPAAPWSMAKGDWEWTSASSDPPDELRSLWHDAVERSRSLVDEVLVEGDPGQLALRRWPDGSAPSLRWILCHMIEEYARHNGHADLIREAIDGETGE
jgi:uncharacterized damage-inducible protein DinB